jgi:hypothetical protein
MITKILYSPSSKKIIFHRKKNANGSRKYVLGEKAKEFFFGREIVSEKLWKKESSCDVWGTISAYLGFRGGGNGAIYA